jgi:hypothetical protein
MFFLFRLARAGMAALRYLNLQIEVSSRAHFMACVVFHSRGFNGYRGVMSLALWPAFRLARWRSSAFVRLDEFLADLLGDPKGGFAVCRGLHGAALRFTDTWHFTIPS